MQRERVRMQSFSERFREIFTFFSGDRSLLFFIQRRETVRKV